jgi:hypothetical protein
LTWRANATLPPAETEDSNIQPVCYPFATQTLGASVYYVIKRPVNARCNRHDIDQSEQFSSGVFSCFESAVR